MSHEINTQLAEELADLEEEMADTEKVYAQARQATNDAHEWEIKVRNNFRVAEAKLKAFKERMQHD